MSEAWKPVFIDGVLWPYEVSNKGRVRRTAGGMGATIGRVLRPGQSNSGYLRVRLSRNWKCKQESIHRLVASAFHGAPEPGFHANHIDGNKLNNDASNLEWVTSSGNRIHAFNSGLQKPVQGEKCGRSKLSESDVHEIRRLGASMDQREIAALFGITQSNVSMIIDRKTWASLPTKQLTELEAKE